MRTTTWSLLTLDRSQLPLALQKGPMAPRPRLQRVFEYLTAVAATCTGWVVSARAQAVFFLAVAALLARAAWIRPALSADVSGLQIPLGLRQADSLSPEQFFHEPGRPRLDSPGGVVLGITALGCLAVLLGPRLLGVVAGLLLCAAVAGNAVIALNQPTLVEWLDRESQEREEAISEVVGAAENSLARNNNSRVEAPPGGEVEMDPAEYVLRGWSYLCYGRWLVVWAAFGILFGSRGAVGRRLSWLLFWTLVAIGLAGAVCWPRLEAEYHWLQAKELEARGDAVAARQALVAATTRFPEFEQLERTWLFAGKLDHEGGNQSPAERFYRAYQLGRHKGQSAPTTHREDLPSRITGTPDHRERRRALTALELLTEEPNGPLDAVVRQRAAWLWTDTGLALYRQNPNLVSASLDYWPHKPRLAAAQDAWKRAATLEPAGRDNAFLLGMVGGRIDPTQPELADRAAGPMLDRIGDRFLKADVLSLLGDVYWESGQFNTARRRYAESSDAFSLPKNVNFLSLKGLGGL
jgi:hypothetical protein